MDKPVRIDGEEAILLAALDMMQSKDASQQSMGRGIRDYLNPVHRYFESEVDRANKLSPHQRGQAITELAMTYGALTGAIIATLSYNVADEGKEDAFAKSVLDLIVLKCAQNLAMEKKDRQGKAG